MTYFGRTSPQINVLPVESVGYYPCRDYTFDESVQSKNASNNVPYFDRVTHNDSTKTEKNRYLKKINQIIVIISSYS